MASRQTVRSNANCLPFLRWAGSKRRLLPILRTYWNSNHTRYLEPFAGSACLFFSLRPPSAILGDVNGDLVSTYREVKYRPKVIRGQLSRLRRTKREYKRLRALDSRKLSRCFRAARFIYLNRCCFNGLYRTNLNGEFNVPYGGEKSGELPSAAHLQECSRRLRTARLVAGDFEVVLRDARRGDFVYMDPPFAVRARRVFNEYHPETFTRGDIARLRLWLERLDRRRISFLVSYAESQEAEILARGFDRKHVVVRRNIAGFARNRSVSHEVLISNV